MGAQHDADAGHGRWQTRCYRLVRFALVGLGNTFVDAAVFNLLTWRSVGLPPIPATLVSGSVAMLAGFLAHQRFTFRVQSTSLCKLIGFVLINLAGVYLLRPWLMHWMMTLPLGATPWVRRNLAFLFAVLTVMVINYLVYRRWVFVPVPPS